MPKFNEAAAGARGGTEGRRGTEAVTVAGG